MKDKFMTYADLLADERWQRKRLKIFDRDDWLCAYCRNEFITPGNKFVHPDSEYGRISKRSLHVHHLKRIRNHMPWEYPDGYLVTLCDICHRSIHNGDNLNINKRIADSNTYTLNSLDEYRRLYPNSQLQYWIDNPVLFSNSDVRAAKMILKERFVSMQIGKANLTFVEDVQEGPMEHYWDDKEKVAYYWKP
jgi:hypothetical protein